jgi:LemA protein
MRYNETVRLFNTGLKRFPTLFIARLFGFAERDYFEASSESQAAPKVKF